MFDFFNLFRQVNWGEYYTFFASGEPPLALQLLLLNTILLMLSIMRRTRGRVYASPEAGRVLQVILIFFNSFILLNIEMEWF